MSANNIIYINKDTYEVFYQSNADEEGLGELIGKGDSLDEALWLAEEKINECGGVVEYGIVYIGGEKNART